MYKRIWYLLVVVFVAVSAIVFVLSAKNFKNSLFNKSSSTASTASSTLTTQSDFELGTYDASRLTISSGSMSINLLGSLDLLSLYNEDNSRLTANVNLATAPNAIDASDATTWEAQCTGVDHSDYWQFDLGATFTVKTLHMNYQEDCNGVTVYYSTNGTDWTNIPLGFGGGAGHGDVDLGAGITARYLKIQINVSSFCTVCGTPGVHDFQITGSHTTTHTTAATQIDGGEYFFEWEAFTPTQTTPANTSISYRYRTSTNGTDWTSWVGAIGSVTSRAGDNRYRYLQVEATLSNTDGTSTPSIDQYDVDYHTNLAPSTPTNLTAVVGE